MKEFDSKEDVIDFWEEKDVCEKENNKPETFHARLTAHQIRSVVNLTGDVRILDAGSGWGRIAKHFQTDGELIGFDITKSLLQNQQQIAPDATQIRGDASQLPFCSNSFDLVYASRMLHYVDNYESILSEFSRVTKPGGNVVIVQPNAWNPYRHFNYYTNLLSPSEVSSSFNRLGFSDVETIYFGFSHPSMPIPVLENIGQIPLIRRIGGLFIVHGTC